MCTKINGYFQPHAFSFSCLFTLIGKDQQMDEGTGNLVKSIPISFDPATSEKICWFMHVYRRNYYLNRSNISKSSSIKLIIFKRWTSCPFTNIYRLPVLIITCQWAQNTDGSGNTEPQTKMFECYPNKNFCAKPC